MIVLNPFDIFFFLSVVGTVGMLPRVGRLVTVGELQEIVMIGIVSSMPSTPTFLLLCTLVPVAGTIPIC